MLFVPQSKTDPGEGAWVFLFKGQDHNLGVCLVRALKQLQDFTSGEDYVFTERTMCSYSNLAIQNTERKGVAVHLSKTTVGCSWSCLLID